MNLQDSKSVVTCSDEARHGFENGDYVTFREVKVSKKLRSIILSCPYKETYVHVLIRKSMSL